MNDLKDLKDALKDPLKDPKNDHPTSQDSFEAESRANQNASKAYKVAEHFEHQGYVRDALTGYSISIQYAQSLKFAHLPLERWKSTLDRMNRISGTLLEVAHRDYQQKNWSQCHELLSGILEALKPVSGLLPHSHSFGRRAPIHPLLTGDILKGRRDEATRLYERNLLTWGEEAYRKARKDGSWIDARKPYEEMTASVYAGEKTRRKGNEGLSRIDNIIAASHIPAGLVIGVLPSRNKQDVTLHIVSKTTDLAIRSKEIQSLLSSMEFQKKLHSIQRILLTREVEQTVGSIDFTKVFPNKVVWRDPSPDEAAWNIKALSEETASLDHFAAVLSLPRNARQQQLLGLTQWTQKDVERASQLVEFFIKKSGIKRSSVTTWSENRGGLWAWVSEKLGWGTTHDKVMKVLQTRKKVLILFAHGDNKRVKLLDGTELTADEISELHLKHKPTVLLFSCEGGKPGNRSDASDSLQQAFKKAGADAIWAFEEKVDVGEAVSIALSLMEKVKSGNKSTLDVWEEVVREVQRKKGPRVRLKVQRDTDFGRRDGVFA